MKVKDLLDSEEKWCQGQYAREIDGASIGPTDPDARQWCLDGAILRCYPDSRERLAVYDRVSRIIEVGVVIFNDAPGRTFAEIRKVIEKADI